MSRRFWGDEPEPKLITSTLIITQGRELRYTQDTDYLLRGNRIISPCISRMVQRLRRVRPGLLVQIAWAARD